MTVAPFVVLLELSVGNVGAPLLPSFSLLPPFQHPLCLIKAQLMTNSNTVVFKMKGN